MVTAPIPRIRGIVPALDRKQLGDTHVVDGRNFVMDVEGPKSAFQSIFLSNQTFTDEDILQWQTFNLSQSDTVVFISNAILRYDALTDHWYPIFTFTKSDPTSRFPWSRARVGGIHYFASKGLGNKIIKYTPLLDTWETLTPVNTTGLMPDDIYLVMQSFGRLVISGETQTQNSAISDGTDLVTSTTKKIGSQSHALVGGGTPIIGKHTRYGFLVYTTEGILRAEFSDQLTVAFRYDVLSEQEHLKPISPFTFIEISDGQHVFLDITGFYQTDGREIKPWQPLMSEWWSSKRRSLFDTTNEENASVRLSINRDRQWVFFSISETSGGISYDYAYVLYLPLDEWGLFSEQHAAFGDLILTTGPESGLSFGYICGLSGCLRKFVDAIQNEVAPDFKVLTNFKESFEFPARNNDDITVVTSEIELTVFDKSLFSDTGLYDTNNAIVVRDIGSLNSYIDIGLFRLLDEKESDVLSAITDVIIGQSAQADTSEVVNYNTLPTIVENWNTITPDEFEDWGQGLADGVIYVAKALGTLDGVKQFADQLETLTQVTDIDEVNTDENENTLYFTCDNTGIFHIIRVEALLTGHSFHMKFVQPTLRNLGRL